MASATPDDKKTKVQRYEEFVNEKLRGDLKVIEARKEQLFAQIADYLQLKTTCETLQSAYQSTSDPKLKTQVDLGCNFFVKAEVPDCRKILVQIGFGFFLELSWSEAISFVDKKVSLLNVQLEQLELDSARCKSYIKLVLEGLAELQSI